MSHAELTKNERNRDLECCICLSEYKIPKQLPCLHTFCLECVKKYCGEGNNAQIPCPLCKRKFTLPQGGVIMLPNNVLITRLILESDLDIKQRICFKCKLCVNIEGETDADSFCLDCQQFLCRRCKILHKKLSCEKCHKIVNIEEKTSNAEMISYMSSFCSRHSSKEMELYCCDCKILICVPCRAAKHNKHFCKVSFDFAREVQSHFAKESECIEQFCSETCEKLMMLEKEKQDFLRQVSSSAFTVKKTTKDIREVLDAYETQLLRELSNIKAKRLKEIESLKEEEELHFSTLDRFISYRKMLLEGTDCEIIRAASDLHRMAEKLMKLQTQKHSQVLGTVILKFIESRSTSQEDIQELVGNISYKDVQQPHINISSKARNIQHNEAVSGIAVVDAEIFVIRYNQSHVNVYDTHSLIASRNFNILDMKSPFGIAGCFYNKALYISDLELKCIHRVDLTKNSVIRWGMRENYWPCGLSVTSEHTLLVTVRISIKKLREFGVVEYTSEGQLVREIRFDGSIDEAWQTVQLSNDQFLVSHGSCSSLHRVCLINSEGQITNFYGGQKGGGEGQLNMPHSLIIDYSSKHIFVADCYNNRVLLLDIDLNYLGQVPRDLKYPSRLYFDSATDRLFVGESSGRLIVIYSS